MLLFVIIGFCIVAGLYFALYWIIWRSREPYYEEPKLGDNIDSQPTVDYGTPTEENYTISPREDSLYSSDTLHDIIGTYIVWGNTVFRTRSEIIGSMGENQVSRILRDLDPNKYFVLNDLLLDVNGSTVQIDHVVLSESGIFVLETKTYNGSIYGSEGSEYWQYYIHGKKFLFRNPILQNKAHIGAIKYTLKRNDLPIIPVVVFAGDCKLRVNRVNYPVIYSYNLINYITSFTQETIHRSVVINCTAELTRLNVSSPERDYQHKQEVRYKSQKSESAVRNGICPRCGGKLVLRTKDYRSFMACENYPKCTYTNRLS